MKSFALVSIWLKYIDDARDRVFVADVLKFGKTQKLYLYKDGQHHSGPCETQITSAHGFGTVTRLNT